jgi:hypothetical protein
MSSQSVQMTSICILPNCTDPYLFVFWFVNFEFKHLRVGRIGRNEVNAPRFLPSLFSYKEFLQ